MNILSRNISSLNKRIKYRIYLYIKSIFEFGENFERYKRFHQNADMHSSVKLLPNATIENLSEKKQLICIGENSVIRGQLLIFAHAGKIEMGKDCYLGEGSRLWSADSIKIGNRVLISHNVNIHDTNSHSLNSVLRHKHFIKLMSEGHPIVNEVDINSKAIIIEDDVWVGFNSTILKGVRIGKGAVVAACSVVTKDVPELVIVAGNPAKILKKI